MFAKRLQGLLRRRPLTQLPAERVAIGRARCTAVRHGRLDVHAGAWRFITARKTEALFIYNRLGNKFNTGKRKA